MILTASQYTDILQFYPEWFINRIRDKQFVIEKQKTNVVYEISPKTVDLLICETKNPAPFLKYTDEYKSNGLTTHFLISVSPYSNIIEKNVDKSKIFESIARLSEIFGRESITWVYSPVILNGTYTTEFHKKYFQVLARRMKCFTNRVIIEFIEPYTPPIHASLYAPEIELQQKKNILLTLHKIAVKNGLKLYADGCMSNKMVFLQDIVKSQTNKSYGDPTQIVDMGLKNTCKGDCEYCYCGGNLFWKKKTDNFPDSPIFIGELDKMKKHIRKKPPMLEKA